MSDIPQIEPAPDADGLIADKYKTADDFAKGYRELSRAVLGVPLPETVPIVGEGGMFADLAAAAAGYKDLQGKFTKIRQPEPQLKIPTPPAAPPAPPASFDDPESAIAAAGLDRNELVKSWVEKGSFSPEQYEALSKVGVGKAAAHAFARAEQMAAENRQLRVAQEIERAAAMVGGRDKVDALLKEAGSFVPKDRVPVLNEMLSRGEVVEAVLAIQGYAGRANRSDFAVGGGSPGPAAPKTIAEENELLAKAVRGDTSAMARLSGSLSKPPTLSILKGNH